MDRPLHIPENISSSPTFLFMSEINAKFKLTLNSYEDLYVWSINHLDNFWSAVWDFGKVIGTKGHHVVDNSAMPSTNPLWFSEARVNWAENMLQCRSPVHVALIQAIEPTADMPEPPLRKCTYLELYTLVRDLVSALLLKGLKPGDRVASYSSHCIENVAACLAATAIGCIWVSAAADFGPEGVCERFEQVAPKVIFGTSTLAYNGKIHNHTPKVATMVALLAERVPELQPNVVMIHSITQHEVRDWNADWMGWDEFVQQGAESQLGRTVDGEIEWSLQSFNWPLWILFSSGTTGRPKPIVHRAGGMLLQMKKEFIISGDLKPSDVFFYYTTGWMMFNFQISALTVGATLVLYDGSPLKVAGCLWELLDKLGITIFGTSAKYLDQLSKGYKPRDHHDLTTLRQIYSTGSPLPPHLYDYVYKDIHPRVLLASITGGTDICSLFAGMCTALPVYRGEIQCRMLGMGIEAYANNGVPTPAGTAGELVCVKPFPCMPLGFWPLVGFGPESQVEAAQARYQDAYFSEYKDVWYHGDHVIITESKGGNAGGVIMLGRSDGVLNPMGVRFGSAELYDVLDTCFSTSVLDYLAVGLAINHGADERVILFVKLAAPETLTAQLEAAIKAEIRSRRSPRHVPYKIIKIDDIPSTLNGKRCEVLVKKIINGGPVANVNSATLQNPACLAQYAKVGDVLRKEVSQEVQ